jgi:hypothetical protein
VTPLFRVPAHLLVLLAGNLTGRVAALQKVDRCALPVTAKATTQRPEQGDTANEDDLGREFGRWQHAFRALLA